MVEAPRRSGARPAHRSVHQLKAEKCNRMENEALRRHVRFLDSDAQRFSDAMFRQKQQLTRQLEATRQTSGHSAVGLRPDNERDRTRVLKSPWFHASSGRISEKDLQRWRVTEKEVIRRCSSGAPKSEITQRERNRRLALTELLRTAGLLDKRTKKVLLPHADFFPQIAEPEGAEEEEEEEEEEELRLDTRSSNHSASARLRAQFPRAYAYCCRATSAPSHSGSDASRGLERAVGRLEVSPHTASPGLLRPRSSSSAPPRRLQPTLPASHFEDDVVFEEEEEEESCSEAMSEEGRAAFAALPKWKRDLLIEAPLFGGEAPSEGVKLTVSKSQLRRDLEELKAENMKRSRLLHASNMKKVFL